jgi:hypothetical protein
MPRRGLKGSSERKAWLLAVPKKGRGFGRGSIRLHSSRS